MGILNGQLKSVEDREKCKEDYCGTKCHFMTKWFRNLKQA